VTWFSLSKSSLEYYKSSDFTPVDIDLNLGTLIP
jgi:hypothetical protein